MDIDKLLTTGIDILNKTIDNMKNPFWKDVLVAWKKLREKSVCSDWDDHIKQPLWYNCDIRIDRNFFRLWYDNGIRYITDLIDYDGRIISFERFQI